MDRPMAEARDPSSAGGGAGDTTGNSSEPGTPQDAPKSLPFRVGPARTMADIAAAKVLWTTYGEIFQDDLGDQDLEAEAKRLPAPFLEPDGLLLLAHVGDAAAGMVAFERLRGTTARMRRLYVDQAWRGRGLGRVLATAIMDAAAHMGYERMVLDTTESMDAAHALYRELGFKETKAPDWDSPCRAPVFMEKRL